MARRSNDAILKDAAEEVAEIILEEVFAALKSSNISMGLRAQRDILDRVLKRIDTMEAAPNGG